MKIEKITAKDLAQFMGISLRALRKLDESGELRAFRVNGRRCYTTEHIAAAIKIMGGGEDRPVTVRFCKNGASSIFGKVPVPTKWLNSLGITSESPEAALHYDGEKIVIYKKD